MAPKGFAVVGLPCRKLPGHQSVDKTRDRDGGGRERSHWCHSHCWGCDGTPVPGPCDGRCAFRRSYANRYLLCIFWRLCAANGRRTLRHGSLATLILTHHFREYLLSARYGARCALGKPRANGVPGVVRGCFRWNCRGHRRANARRRSKPSAIKSRAQPRADDGLYRVEDYLA